MTPPAVTRRVGVWSATALVISHTIAVGIFLTPAQLIGSLASPVLTLGLWIGAALAILAGAFTFGELASRYPQAGGLYVYLREAWGRRVAFLYGWQAMLIMDPGVTSALATGAAQYTSLVWPVALGHEKAIATALVWGLAGLNMLGLAFGARVFGIMTLVKLCTLFGIVVLAFGSGLGEWSHFVAPAVRPSTAPPVGEAVAVALVGIFFSFGGFWETSRIAAEVRDPRRSVPRALAFGVLSVTAIYVLTTAAFIYLVSPDAATSAPDVARRVGTAIFGAKGPAVLASIVLVSVVASAMAMVMVSPRLYEAMSRDGLFPVGLTVRDHRTGAPVRATAILAVFSTLFVQLGTFEQIVTFFIATAMTFVALAALALVVILRRSDEVAGYRAPGYPLTPAVFVLFVMAVVVMVAVNRPVQTAAGLAIVALGLAAERWLLPARAHAVGRGVE
jgi:basic amino acid/polyamine antiporter, APA family